VGHARRGFGAWRRHWGTMKRPGLAWSSLRSAHSRAGRTHGRHSHAGHPHPGTAHARRGPIWVFRRLPDPVDVPAFDLAARSRLPSFSVMLRLPGHFRLFVQSLPLPIGQNIAQRFDEKNSGQEQPSLGFDLTVDEAFDVFVGQGFAQSHFGGKQEFLGQNGLAGGFHFFGANGIGVTQGDHLLVRNVQFVHELERFE
jgi:hypothetical protein